MSRMSVERDNVDSGFILMGFDEEEIAQGVSIIKAMFQLYISQYPDH